MIEEVIIEGRGLHTGQRTSVCFRAAIGPVRLLSRGAEARIDELGYDGSRRSTCATTRDGRIRISTVEHLFAALAAASIREGVTIEVDGPELPLVDGGARAFADALGRLDLRPSPSPLTVVRRGVIDLGTSRYDLYPPSRPDEVRVEVDVDFGDARLAKHARWDGDPADFLSRIAPARTFGFEGEMDELIARGLATHVTPESVVVIAKDRILVAGHPFLGDEPARHKLLDLIGDLYAHGGPPIGHVRATRPGHAKTHDAMRQALAAGFLARAPRD